MDVLSTKEGVNSTFSRTIPSTPLRAQHVTAVLPEELTICGWLYSFHLAKVFPSGYSFHLAITGCLFLSLVVCYSEEDRLALALAMSDTAENKHLWLGSASRDNDMGRAS